MLKKLYRFCETIQCKEHTHGDTCGQASKKQESGGQENLFRNTATLITFPICWSSFVHAFNIHNFLRKNTLKMSFYV